MNFLLHLLDCTTWSPGPSLNIALPVPQTLHISVNAVLQGQIMCVCVCVCVCNTSVPYWKNVE
jgi:hypothetical protein